MKKISLLALTLLSSIAAIHANEENKKPHTCSVMARGNSSLKAKSLFDVATIAFLSKFKIPAALAVALFPFIHDLTDVETAELLNNAEVYGITHPNHVTAVSQLTNGWNVMAASLAIYGAEYLYYKKNLPEYQTNLSDDQNQNIVTHILYAYIASQLTAIAIARNAVGKDLVPCLSK